MLSVQESNEEFSVGKRMVEKQVYPFSLIINFWKKKEFGIQNDKLLKITLIFGFKNEYDWSDY